jgi:cell division protein FtsL
MAKMKAPAARHEKNGSQSKICVICLIGVLISAMSLGSLRLYGLYLEHRLAYLTARIEAVNNKNAVLEERFSSLLSPSRIYNYAKTELNMVTASDVQTIRLRKEAEGSAVAASGNGPGRSANAPHGLASLFIGTANAKD